MAESPIIELADVSKQFLGVTAVSGLSMSVWPGQILCLLGENGAGKSTVIKLLTGVERPSAGTLRIDGTPKSFSGPREAREHGIATVYQEGGTLPLMSVARNFVLAAEPTRGWGPFKKIDMKKAGETALAGMRELGISRVRDWNQPVGTLSGGERQALSIARALHFGARLLILDEPTAALGVRESATVLQLIESVKNRGVGVVFVTHNAHHAYSVGDRFLVLRQGEALDEFDQGDRSMNDVVELMSGGRELDRLLGGG